MSRHTFFPILGSAPPPLPWPQWLAAPSRSGPQAGRASPVRPDRSRSSFQCVGEILKNLDLLILSDFIYLFVYVSLFVYLSLSIYLSAYLMIDLSNPNLI